MSAAIRKLQMTIHAAAREIGISSQDRQAMQLIATGKASTSEMTEAELQVVVDALKARGWSPKGRGGRKTSARPDIRFVHVLWRLLGDGGHVQKDRQALNSFIRTRFGARGAAVLDVDMMRDPQQIAAVTEALKAMCKRHSIPVERRPGGRAPR